MHKNKRIVAILLVCLIICFAVIYFMFSKRNKANDYQYTLSPVRLNKIDVDWSNGSVNFRTGNHYRVIYSGNKKMQPDIEIKNGALSVNDKSGVHVYKGNIFDLFKHTAPTLIVEMPKKELKEVSLDLNNGSVDAKELRAISGEMDLSNGSVNIQNFEIRKGFEMDLSNGKVTINHSSADGYDLSTSLGKITFNGKNEGGSYEKNSDDENTLEINNSNGSININ